MSKQRECPWRREIKKEKSIESAEDRRRREALKKGRLQETWQKKKELLDKRRALRMQMKQKDEEREKEILENRRIRMTLQKKRKVRKELYN